MALMSELIPGFGDQYQKYIDWQQNYKPDPGWQNSWADPNSQFTFGGSKPWQVEYTAQPWTQGQIGGTSETDLGGSTTHWYEKVMPILVPAVMAAMGGYAALGGGAAGAGAGAGASEIGAGSAWMPELASTGMGAGGGAGAAGAGAGGAGFFAGATPELGPGAIPMTVTAPEGMAFGTGSAYGMAPLEATAGELAGMNAGTFTGATGGIGSGMGSVLEGSGLGTSLASTGYEAFGGSGVDAPTPSIDTSGIQNTQQGGGTVNTNKPPENYLDKLLKNWPTMAMFGAGAGLDLINSRKIAENQQQSAQQYMDMISGLQGGYQGNLDKAFMSAMGQNDQNYADYIGKFNEAQQAAKPDIPAYTRAVQGIVSEQSEAAKRRAAEKAADAGRGGGSYQKDLDLIKRNANETTARGLLPLYSGTNLPVPQVQQTVTPQVAPPIQPNYSAIQGLNASGSNEWLSKLLGLGGQYLSQTQMQSMLEQILKGTKN